MSLAKTSKGTTSNMAAHLSPACESELRQFIRTRTGIIVQDHQRDNLNNTVATAMQRYGHSQCESFMESLRAAENNSPELEFLIAGITVGESYFFRDTSQINFLRDQYLPELIAKRTKTDKYMRIWSAGCSDGQELYTLALLLRELIPDLENWRLHLLGTDINTETLATCMHGHYREWSFRNTPESIRSRYFHSHKTEFELHEDVRRMARFAYLNLAEDAFPSLLTDTSNIDLILCRNVFIYFDQATVKNVLQKFAQCLVPEGILMLGASDLVDNNVSCMELIQANGTFYYRRQHSDKPVKALNSQVAKPPPIKSLPPHSRKIKKPSTKPINNKIDPIQELRQHLAQEQWQTVDELADSSLETLGESAELLRYKATAAANLGKLEQASQLCERALELDPIDKHSHFLSAIVLMELEQTEAAEATLRKVLFLDAQFLEAHYQLGLLHLRCGRQSQGIKSLKNALHLAEKGDPQYCLHGAPDTSYQRMVEVLSHEIKLYETSARLEIK